MAHEQSGEQDGGPALVRNNRVDAVVATLLVIVGLVVVFEARRLGAAGCDSAAAGHRGDARPLARTAGRARWIAAGTAAGRGRDASPCGPAPGARAPSGPLPATSASTHAAG